MTEKAKTSRELRRAKRIVNPLPVPVQKRLLTIPEAAFYLGRRVSSVRHLIWSGRLPYVPEGKRFYLDLEDLEKYIRQNKTLVV